VQEVKTEQDDADQIL